MKWIFFLDPPTTLPSFCQTICFYGNNASRRRAALRDKRIALKGSSPFRFSRGDAVAVWSAFHSMEKSASVRPTEKKGGVRSLRRSCTCDRLLTCQPFQNHALRRALGISLGIIKPRHVQTCARSSIASILFLVDTRTYLQTIKDTRFLILRCYISTIWYAMVPISIGPSNSINSSPILRNAPLLTSIVSRIIIFPGDRHFVKEYRAMEDIAEPDWTRSLCSWTGTHLTVQRMRSDLADYPREARLRLCNRSRTSSLAKAPSLDR